MSREVDTKVVTMQFDNRNFERNVSQTMNTIDKLKAKLKFDKAAEGIDNIDKAAKRVHFNSLSSGIDSVRVKMGLLDTFCFNAFSRISNAAITTGKNIVKAFTIDPVKSGLEEYETQINAVQTILANTSWQGTNIHEVNAALDELNHYADLTIYNFTEMTRNIGTFTAAGLDLDTSVKGIQGVANLAAVSGSNAQQASTAMYQLSQALSAGSVHLQDWNSVVNAGMGGKVFQDAIIKTAKEMGALEDATLQAYETGTSFRELLNAKNYGNWFSSDVLANALAKFTKSGAVEYLSDFAGISQTSLQDLQNLGDKVGYNSKQFKEMALSISNGDKALANNIRTTLAMATTATDAATKVKTFSQLKDTLMEAAQSGWTQTWTLIIGDFEEAKTLFTEASDYLSNIINNSANKRNSLIKGAMQNLVKINEWEQLKKAGVATKAFQNALVETAEKNGVSVKQMIRDNGSFTKSLKEGWLNKDIINQTLKKNEKQLSQSTMKMTKEMKKYFKVANQVMSGSWGKGKAAQEALTKAGYDYTQVQTFISGINKYGAKSFEKLCLAQMKSEGVTKKQAKSLTVLAKEAKKTGTPINEFVKNMNKMSGRELLIDSIRNSAIAVIKPFRAMKKAWSDVFPPMSSQNLYDAINALHNLTEKMVAVDKDGNKMTRTFKGVFSAVKLVTTIVGGGARLAFAIISNVLKRFNLDILEVTATIGDYITKAEEWISKNDLIGKVAKIAGAGISKLVDEVRQLINWLSDLPKVQNGIKTVQSAFNGFAKSGNDVSKITDKINSLKNISLSDVINTLTSFKAKAVNVFNNTGSVISDFKDKIISTASAIKNKLGNVDIFGSLLAIGAGVMIITTVRKISKALEILGNVMEGFGGIFEHFAGILDTAKGTLKAYSTKLKSEALLNVAKSIAILAASLFVLSKVKPANLFSAAGALTIVTVALAGLCAIIGKFNIRDVGKISSTMLGISSSLLILIVAMKKMDKLNPEYVIRNVTIITLLLAELGAVAVAIGKFGGKVEGMAGMILFVVSLRMMINVLKKMDNVQDVKGNLIAVTAMMGIMIKMSTMARGIKFSSGAGMILMVVSLRMFIKALNSLSNFDYNKLENNLGGVVIILLAFASVAKMSSKSGQYSAKAGAAMLGVSLSMLIIAAAIKKMAGISPEEMNKAGDVIAKMTVLFTGVVLMSNFAGKNAAKAGAMILMFSGALVAVSACVVILSQLDPEGVKRGTDAISQLIVCFGVMVAASGLSKDCKTNILTMTGAIGAMAIAIGALTFVDPEKLKTTTAAMTAMMLSFSAMTASTHFSDDCKAQLVVMTVVIALLGGIITGMCQLPIQNAIEASGSLSLLLVSFSAAMAIASKSDEISGKTIAAMYAISGIVALLAGILTAMSVLDVGPTIETSASLSMLLVSMSGVCAILSAIGPISSGAIKGAAALAGVIVIIGTLMVGIGALVDKFPVLEEFAGNGIAMLNKVASGIGQFVGNLIGGVGKGLTDNLPAIGKNLAEFSKTLAGVDPKTAESAKYLSQTLLTLGGAQIVNAITSFITGSSSMADFGTQLKAFGQGIVDFSSTISGKINAKEVESAAEAGKKIADFAGTIPKSGGWLQNLLGNSDLESFGSQVKYLAQGIVEFGQTIANGRINIAQTDTAVATGKKIAELANTIPSTGGWLQNLIGAKNIDKFGSQIKFLAQGIVEFGQTISKGNIDVNATNKATEAGRNIIEIASTIPKSGGWLQNITGTNNFDTFGKNMKLLGTGIARFAKSVEDIGSTRGVNSAVSAGKSIIELCDSISGSSRAIKTVSKSKNFDKLEKNLKIIGECAVSVSEGGLASASSDMLKKAYNNANSLLSITRLIQKVNSNNIKELPNSSKQLSAISIKSFTNGFAKSKSQVTSTIGNTLNNAINSIKDKRSGFSNAGVYCVDGFITGIRTKVSNGNIYGAGQTIGNEALRGAKEALDIHSPSRKMKEVAKNTVDGFVNFINGKGKKNVKSSMGNTVNEAAKDTDKKAKKASNKATKNAGNRTKSNGKKHAKTVKNTVKKVSAEFTSSMKTELAKAEKTLKSHSNIDKILTNTLKKYTKVGSKSSTVYKYAKGAVTKFANAYVKSSKDVKKNTEKASNAVAKFANRLYQQSDAYKTDKQNLKSLLKTLKDYYKEKVKITKKLTKVKTENDAKQLKKDLKDVEKNIKKSQKAVSKYQKTVTNNIKKTFNELKTTIKNTLKDYTDLFQVTSEAINLFDTSVLENAVSGTSSEVQTNLSESLKNFISICDVTLDTGLDIFTKFSDGVEDKTESIKQAEESLAEATQNLADANKELEDANNELIKAQAKSDSVFGRSERYLEKVAEAQQKVAEAQQKVTDATNSQAEAQKNLDDLNTDTSVSDMLENMESNSKAIDAWRSNLEKLSERGINDNLLKYLEDLGVNGSAQVATFVKMTDEELKKAGDLFTNFSKKSSKNLMEGFEEKKEKLLNWGESIKKFGDLDLDAKVKEALLTEFQEQGVDSADYVNAVLNMSKEELAKFNKDYLEILKVPDNVAEEVITAREKIDKATTNNETKTDAADDYITTMKANLDAQKEYEKNLDELHKKVKDGIISQDFYDYIASLGTDSADIVKAFLKSSNGKLEEANKLYKESAEMAGNTFLDNWEAKLTDENAWSKNLEKVAKLNIPGRVKDAIVKEAIDQGVDSNSILETILGFTPEQLSRFVKDYEKKLDQVSSIADSIIASRTKTSNQKANESAANKSKNNSKNKVTNKSKNNSKTGTAKIINASAGAVKTVTQKLVDATSNSAHKIGDKAVSELGVTLSKNIPNLSSLSSNIGSNIAMSLANELIGPTLASSGRKMCSKISDDINENSGIAIQSASDLGSGITATISDKLLKISSINPIAGLVDYVNNSKQEIKTSSDETIQIMEDTIRRVSEAGSSETITPTIKPVLDMSDVNSGLSTLHTMLSANAMGVNATLAVRASRGIQALNSRQNGSGSVANYNYDTSTHTIENHFSITGDNPKQIANEVSRILQRQINRRGTTWA